MLERIERVMPEVRGHMEESQHAQQRAYNQPAQPCEFHTGDRVLMLIPTATCSFFLQPGRDLTRVEGKLGPSNYRVRQPDRQVEQPLCIVSWHRWKPHLGDALSPTQKLNEVSQCYSYPMPRVDELIKHL